MNFVNLSLMNQKEEMKNPRDEEDYSREKITTPDLCSDTMLQKKENWEK